MPAIQAAIPVPGVEPDAIPIDTTQLVKSVVDRFDAKRTIEEVMEVVFRENVPHWVALHPDTKVALRSIFKKGADFERRLQERNFRDRK